MTDHEWYFWPLIVVWIVVVQTAFRAAINTFRVWKEERRDSAQKEES